MQFPSIATDAAPDMSILAQYGVLGIFAILLVAFARTSYKRETDRSDRLEAEVSRLNEVIAEKCIPALVTATAALEESAELLRDIQRERERHWAGRGRDD